MEFTIFIDMRQSLRNIMCVRKSTLQLPTIMNSVLIGELVNRPKKNGDFLHDFLCCRFLNKKNIFILNGFKTKKNAPHGCWTPS